MDLTDTPQRRPGWVHHHDDININDRPTMSEQKTYTANYGHDGRVWVVTYDEPDVSTWARTLRKAREHSRELLAAILGFESVEALANAGIVIEDRISLPAGLSDEAAELRAARAQLDELARELAKRTDHDVHILVDAGLPMRDIADALGVSHQRVAQIAGAEPR